MKQTILKCDNCGKQFIDCSPPSEEAYKSGFINMGNHSSMLLPTPITKKGFGKDYAISLEGEYCNAYCLIKKLNKLIKKHKIKNL